MSYERERVRVAATCWIRLESGSVTTDVGSRVQKRVLCPELQSRTAAKKRPSETRVCLCWRVAGMSGFRKNGHRAEAEARGS